MGATFALTGRRSLDRQSATRAGAVIAIRPESSPLETLLEGGQTARTCQGSVLAAQARSARASLKTFVSTRYGRALPVHC